MYNTAVPCTIRFRSQLTAVYTSAEASLAELTALHKHRQRDKYSTVPRGTYIPEVTVYNTPLLKIIYPTDFPDNQDAVLRHISTILLG